jgi:hypothetical protein
VYSVQCSVFSAQCTVFSVQCSVFSVQCSVFSVQCSVFSGSVCSVQRTQASDCEVKECHRRCTTVFETTILRPQQQQGRSADTPVQCQCRPGRTSHVRGNTARRLRRRLELGSDAQAIQFARRFRRDWREGNRTNCLSVSGKVPFGPTLFGHSGLRVDSVSDVQVSNCSNWR